MSSEAKNLEAISKAIDHHNATCEYPAVAIAMNPFELERLLTAAGAELAVVSSHRSVLEPTTQQLGRAGRALRGALELAEALPAKHRPTLEFPRLTVPKARTR